MSLALQRALTGLLVGAMLPAALAQQQRSYRLPETDLKQPVIWGSTCEAPDGTAMSFGGQDQHSEDGPAHTRIRQGGTWQRIDRELRDKNALQGFGDRARSLAREQKDTAAYGRAAYFAGLTAADERRLLEADVHPRQEKLAGAASILARALRAAPAMEAYEAGQAQAACAYLDAAAAQARSLVDTLAVHVDADAIKQMGQVQSAIEKAAQALDAEPPARALSPIVYEPRSRLFVLFGGDHLDHLTNDTWVFDAARQRWMQRRPPSAPPPRANHVWTSAQDGKVIFAGGYTYASNTDHCGGQYRDIADGPWTYDIAGNTWSGGGQAAPGDSRTYRTGPFHPDDYLQGPKADAAAFQKWLASIPVNTWMLTRPPHLPRLNRDWGTAALDIDRDLILRFSGGHSAHGGTDVLHYHLATNRWELPFPVEFPLGQLYANTSYPDGYNFNRRPWITGHTYQNYGYDALARRMIFTGRPRHFYIYDPDVGDWTGRGLKPEGMSYPECFYTLTLCATPQGTIAWTARGGIFRFDAGAGQWRELKTTGVKLPGAVVDNSTLVYDAKRRRLLFVRKEYGDTYKYDGKLYALDLQRLNVTALTPDGHAGAAAIPYLCQIRYDAANDLMLVGATLPRDGSTTGRTPAYDGVANRWVSMLLVGDDPNGKSGRNVSLGLMYDARRRLFWAVDTDSKVYVLRLEPGSAQIRQMQ